MKIEKKNRDYCNSCKRSSYEIFCRYFKFHILHFPDSTSPFEIKYIDTTRIPMLGKLNSSPLRGNIAIPPAAPIMDALVAEQDKHAEANPPPRIPPKPARFFLPPKDLVTRTLYIIMEIVIPERMHTAMMDENNAGPAAYSMFAAPFVVTSASNFGDDPSCSAVTNVEKLLARIKTKNMENVISTRSEE